MADQTNAEAFIAAADKVTAAAAVLPDPSLSAQERADRIAGTLAALAGQDGSGWLTGVLEAIQAAGPPADTTSSTMAGDPTITCSDGSKVSIPAPEVGSLNKVTDTSTDFFPSGPGASIFKFIFNALADVAAGFAIFGQIGAIQSRELINGFNAIRPTATISPEVAADMAERNKLPYKVAEAEAKAGGIGPERFKVMVDSAGEPYGIVQALSLLRRGLIDESAFATIVAESRVYTKYICDLEKLAHETMSGADAIESYIKGVPVTLADFTNEGLTPSDTSSEEALRNEFFAAMFRRAGGLPHQWELLKQGAGDAIGVQRATALEAHGLITHDQLLQIIARSRINPIFNYAAVQGNAKWFASFQVGKMLSTGGAKPEQATQWLLQDGYPADQVAAFVAAYGGEKAAKARAETEAQLATAYEAGLITQTDFEDGLKSLGYPAGALPGIEKTIRARRVLAQQLAAVNRVRASYLARHIDWTKAHADLISLGVDPAVVNHYGTIWPIELDSEVKALTPSQLGSLVREGREGKAAAIAMWEQMGYSATEADLMYRHYAPTADSLKRGAISPDAPP